MKSIRILTALSLLLGGVAFAVVTASTAFAQSAATSTQATSTLPALSAQAGQAGAPTPALSPKEEERRALEAQLAALEKQIEDNQDTINQYQKQGKSLKNEIGTLNAKIAKLNLQIKAVNVTLTKLSDEIAQTQQHIGQTETNIETHKDAISRALREIYESDSQGIVEIMLATNRLSDFFGYINNVTQVQENLRVALAEIVQLRQDLLAQKEELSTQKDDAENLRAIQQSQKAGVQSTQTQKTQLLNVTKGKESEYQKILAKTKESAAQIRSRIFELLGGGELTFEKAYDYAKLAEGATGVRAALILAVLNRESLLGKNVGRCSYTTAMHPTRDMPYFLDLLKRLGIDPSSEFAKVSCANQHGSYGGAMGPAQFIPSTWKLYESKITAVTGNNPPSPWNNADAFAATAVYMKDLLASGSCKDYANANKNAAPYQTLLERCAAAKYYSGSKWYTYRFWYGEPVVVKANEYEGDIKLLKGA
ncbi:MAG: lytic murein transglycosylase [Candidatus Brennerbacteria bacterium]